MRSTKSLPVVVAMLAFGLTAAPAFADPDKSPTEISAAAAASADGPAAATKAVPPPPKPAVTLSIDIDLTRQTMTVADGKARHQWMVSSGARDYPTPTGMFRPQWMAKMWYSRKYDDAPMPHAIFFSGGAAIHATSSTGRLGQPASHGCVRLAPANAQLLYGLVNRHGMASTRIVVHGRPKFYDVPVASRAERAPRLAAAPRPIYPGYGVPPGYDYARNRAVPYGYPRYTRTIVYRY